MGLEKALSDSSCVSVRVPYLNWSTFIDIRVKFDRDSSTYNISRCKRVLLFSLMIGHSLGFSDNDLNALAAAVCLHDAKRQNDGIDPGHGKRAAALYMEMCCNMQLVFDKRSYLALKYHDLDDCEAIKLIAADMPSDKRAIQIYKIVKDADMLDEVKDDDKDEAVFERLRTESAKSMVKFAKQFFAA